MTNAIEWDFIRPAIEKLSEMAVQNGDDICALKLTAPDGQTLCTVVLAVGEHAGDCIDKAITLIDAARLKQRTVAQVEVDA